MAWWAGLLIGWFVVVVWVVLAIGSAAADADRRLREGR